MKNRYTTFLGFLALTIDCTYVYVTYTNTLRTSLNCTFSV